MFTIAAVATNVCALPVGTVLDVYGPKVSGIVGSFCLALGAIFMGFAKSLPGDGYILGYLLLSLGGPFVFISSFHLSNAFPTRSGLILSTLTGAFDASSALFLIFRLINDKTNGRFDTTKFFTLYLVAPVFILFAQIFVMPATSYKTAGELVQEAEEQVNEEANDRVDGNIPDSREGERQRNDRRLHRQSVVSQIQDLLDDNEVDNGLGDENGHGSSYYKQVKGYLFGHEHDEHGNADTDENGNDASGAQHPPQPQQQQIKAPTVRGIWGVLHGYSAVQQILTPWFILITAFTILQMLRINYFVASINQQYTYLLSSAKKAMEVNQVFDFLLPLGGLVSVPFIGTILDNVPTQFVLLILVAVATIIGIFGCIPHSLAAAYGNIILFVLYRPFYYTAVSDYSAKVFGFQTFGKVYGLIICCAGLGNFLQAGLDTITFKVFHRDPIPVNSFLAVAGFVIGGSLVAFVYYQASLIEKAANQQGDTVDNSGGASQGHEREPLLSRGRSERARDSNGNEGTVTYGTVV